MPSPLATPFALRLAPMPTTSAFAPPLSMSLSLPPLTPCGSARLARRLSPLATLWPALMLSLLTLPPTSPSTSVSLSMLPCFP
eukprot:5292653-Heterocapsa_arctica.AAC.1